MSVFKVFCVMVSYNPDIEKICESIGSVLSNGVKLILVDNGSINASQVFGLVENHPKAVFFGLEKNEGIAAAQNIGIRAALEEGADYIWLSDQDTIYEESFSERMLNCFSLLDESVAAIGPSFYDTNREAVQPIVNLAPFTTKKIPSPGLNHVSHMIASGMFIPAEKIKLIGLKQEDLFIDWVDMEWCWRAENIFKQKLFVTGDVSIKHTLGDLNAKFLGRKIILRSPFRHYFMVRNAIALSIYSRSLAPFTRVELFAKAIVWVALFPLLAPSNKIHHVKSTLAGALHGLSNKLGAMR